MILAPVGPSVSIVTATYNRSNVLSMVIDRVLAGSFSDWEMIVVGDACTDDTGSMIASVGDPRIRFVNLPVNNGEQSTPNNEGVRLAQGKFVAFLNHDDFWLPQHLERTVAVLRRGDAPFVHSLALVIGATGETRITGATRGRYEPWAFVPASTWVCRRELFDTVGPWRNARDLHIAPSADWLHRAWRMKVPMATLSEVTTIAIVSGSRRDSYSERQADEHHVWLEALRNDPAVVSRVVESLAIHGAVDDVSIVPHLKRAIRNSARRLAMAAGFHPFFPKAVLSGRRGGFINSLRRVRGLPPLAPRG